MSQNIVFLCSHVNIGDVDARNAIVTKLETHSVAFQKYTLDANEQYEAVVQEYKLIAKKDIIFAFGEKGAELLAKLNQDGLINNKESYLALSIHQFDNNIKSLPLDYIALPRMVVNTEEKTEAISKIPSKTLTFSVATHNPTIAELKIAYDNWNIQNKPSLDDNYIIIMLPGDAPDPAGRIRFFSKDSADNLLKDITELLHRNGNQHKIIVHNGPRTGKYRQDEDDLEVACKHLFSNQIDEISLYFLELLNKNNIDYVFYNFFFDNNKPVSVFHQLLYIAQTKGKDNYFILPGESTSMLGQLPLYLTGDKIIVFKASSMNEDHEKVFHLAVEHNYVSYFTENYQIVKPDLVVNRERDDADSIVLDLLAGKTIDEL